MQNTKHDLVLCETQCLHTTLLFTLLAHVLIGSSSIMFQSNHSLLLHPNQNILFSALCHPHTPKNHKCACSAMWVEMLFLLFKAFMYL